MGKGVYRGNLVLKRSQADEDAYAAICNERRNGNLTDGFPDYVKPVLEQIDVAVSQAGFDDDIIYLAGAYGDGSWRAKGTVENEPSFASADSLHRTFGKRVNASISPSRVEIVVVDRATGTHRKGVGEHNGVAFVSYYGQPLVKLD